MGNACAGESGAVTVVEPVGGKIIVKFWSADGQGVSCMGRGFALAPLMELAGAPYGDFEFVGKEFPAPMGNGDVSDHLFRYLPQLEFPNGKKITELAAVATFLAFSYPQSKIAVKLQSDIAVSGMAAAKGNEMWAEWFNVHYEGEDEFTQEQVDALIKKEDEYMRPAYKVFESLMDADGKLTSTGTSFGEVVYWWMIHQHFKAKVAGLDTDALDTPKTKKFLARMEALPEIQTVLSGKSKFRDPIYFLQELPDKFRKK